MASASSVAVRPWWRRVLPSAVLQRTLGTAAAAAPGFDAYVHLNDAGFYDAVRTSAISQGTLFRVQGAVAAAAGLALLVRPSRLWRSVAVIVAVSAFGAVMLYRYADVGALRPIPDMYEPTWAPPGKLASAWAEGAATILTAAGLLVAGAEPSRRGQRWNHR